MPRGDVTPECCIRNLTVKQLNDQRPVKSVPPSRPLDPKVTPAAPHMDQAAFPALPSSTHEGIRGIPGTKDFPMGTTEGFQAFIRPNENTVVPRAAPGRTGAPPSTTTTATTPSPAVTTAVVTTTTATTSVLSYSAVVGKKTLGSAPVGAGPAGVPEAQRWAVSGETDALVAAATPGPVGSELGTQRETQP